jgi:excisionase family DNA binding protein
MELLTVDETARLLKVTQITVRRFIAEGRLPAVRVGRAVRVRREALDQLLKPVEPQPNGRPARPGVRGRRFTRNDALFNIVGIADDPSDPTPDVSENKLKYLAEAYTAHSE